MPRDRDKNNDSRGRRDRPPAGKARSGKPRGPEKKLAKRGFGGKGEDRPFRRRDEDDRPRRDFGDRPRFDRDDRPRGERPGPRRDDRPARGRERDEGRPAGRSADRKFGDRRPSEARGERSERKFGGERKFSGDRKFGGERKFSRGGGDRNSDRRDRDGDRQGGRGDRARDYGDRKRDYADRKSDHRDRGPRKDFDRGPRKEFGGRGRDRDDRFEGRDRGELKPWQKREAGARGDRDRDERPRFSRPREDRERGDRPFRERPKFDRPRERRDDDRPRRDRKSARPEGRTEWQEHPRSEGRFADRPRRDNEDDSKIFAKRPAFGGRGAYREREESDRRAARPEPKPKKSGERIAKVLARAGMASRRDAEDMVTQGRVTVNGRVINSPALDVTANDVVAVDGEVLPPRERTRLFLYHKPRGLMTTHADPEGRPTVFDNLPEGLPRLISIGRLDFNTEGLLLLTNDGGLARVLELPDTGWLRRYRVRAHGEVTQAQLDELKNGIEVEGVKYGSIDATLERDQGANVWLTFAIREGKNREVRNVMAHLGLEVNRLIRISYGPFQLGELAEGQVEEVRTRVLREQLGEKVAKLAGADFNRPEQRAGDDEDSDSPRGKKAFKPSGKSALIADRKGRRVLVQRTGSEEARARNEAEASGWGPPRRPQRGYHGKRDLKPKDDE